MNPHVPNAIAALQVVDASYTIQLEAEYSKTRTQYATYVRNEVFRRDALAKKGDFTGSEAINRRLALTRPASAPPWTPSTSISVQVAIMGTPWPVS